jgi:hypothetical protein
MRFRLWPRSLIGQLVFAVAAALFIAQAINFALLVGGQRQQSLAHSGGMAAARIIDAVERDRRGVDVFSSERRGDHSRDRDGDRDRQRLRVSDASPQLPHRAAPMPELAAYVAGLLTEAEVGADRVEAWVLPSPPRVDRPDARSRPILVAAHVDGQYFAVRGRIATGGERMQGFLLWQTLTLYLLLLVPVLFIAWRAAGPLRGLTRHRTCAS